MVNLHYHSRVGCAGMKYSWPTIDQESKRIFNLKAVVRLGPPVKDCERKSGEKHWVGSQPGSLLVQVDLRTLRNASKTICQVGTWQITPADLEPTQGGRNPPYPDQASGGTSGEQAFNITPTFRT
ncbi:hypothetical protein RSAG8_06968, partial [Rhizoctonia solani AG-8 WAC10335]